MFAGTYDPDLKASPHVLNVTGYTPSIVIDDFNEPDAVNQPGKWTSGAGAEKVTYADRYANGPNSPYEGSHVLEVWSDEVKAYEWRTVSRDFDQPLDLSDVNYLTFAANCYGWQTEDYLIKVTLFSGEDSYESIAQINPEQLEQSGGVRQGLGPAGLRHQDRIRVHAQLRSRRTEAGRSGIRILGRQLPDRLSQRIQRHRHGF